MRQLLIVISFAILSITCNGQGKKTEDRKTGISIDIGAAISRGGLRIGIEQQFAKNWSIEGQYEINLQRAKRKMNQEESDHYKEFMTESINERISIREMVSSDIWIRYWLKEANKGGHIMTGIRHGIRNGIDFTIGAGYSFIIWKGLGLSLSYETVLGQIEEDGFTLTLSYIY